MATLIKRNVRGYKIADKYYDKAMKVAQKKWKKPLANIIEQFVIDVSAGNIRPNYDGIPDQDGNTSF